MNTKNRANLYIIRFFSIIFLIFMQLYSCYAYEIVLPKNKKLTTINTNVLFIGKANKLETININNEPVHIAANGAFAHTVKLKDGENRIVVRSNFNTQIYRIKKMKYINKEQAELVNFNKKLVLVKRDNVPLRSTPVDAGLNRISHLFKDTNIYINGEKGDFYRVFLAKDKEAWILKKDIDDSKLNLKQEKASFIDMTGKVYKNANEKSITFTKNLPYVVEEVDDEIIFRVYNPEVSDESCYTISFTKPKKYYYKVSLDNGKYTFKIAEIPQNLKDCTVVIDPGHGGIEKGALGCLGTYEKDVNLKVALELQKILKSNGVSTVMTRECDGNITLDDRINIARDNGADIFISIHHNSIPDVPFCLHKHRGTSIYYYNNNSKDFAQILEKTVTKSAKTKKSGVYAASFAVVRPSYYVGVLIETSYMINPLDSVMYMSEEYSQKVASGIFKGLEEFIEDNK